MANENHFVYNPSTVDIRRSKFLINSYWKGDIYHGDLVPLEITRVMPGDSAKYDLNVFIRTATPPIAPFMDTVRLSIAAFYVPERLVWDKEKEFLGENRDGYGIQSAVLAPRSTQANMTVPKNAAAVGYKRSFGTYLGIVRQNTGTITNYSPISLNPIRSLLQVYNDWFRNENFMAPYLWNHTQTGDGAARDIATLNGSSIYSTSDLPKVCKQLDRFTSCLPWAQKGLPVLLPLGSTAPIITESSSHSMGTNNLRFGASSAGATADFLNGNLELEVGEVQAVTGSVGPTAYRIDRSNLVADLSNATAASVNQLRLAFATQRYLEALARSGSKYREYIKGVFGVNIGDTTAQMAEYLGGMTIELNVDQVLQTTGFAAGGSTTLGAPGASCISASSGYLFTKSFDEPGFLVVVAYTKHNRSYGQGIEEIYQKHDILEEYNPKFANIGEQAIKQNSIYFDGDSARDDDRFGFQEAWSEYKHIKDKVVGALNPSNSSSFNFWSLADNYASSPSLNAAFLTEDRDSITRCLSGGVSSPDYFLDIKFKRTFVRPMPLYDIPGLIDHH